MPIDLKTSTSAQRFRTVRISYQCLEPRLSVSDYNKYGLQPEGPHTHSLAKNSARSTYIDMYVFFHTGCVHGDNPFNMQHNTSSCPKGLSGLR